MWKKVVGWEETYEVSSNGQVRTSDTGRVLDQFLVQGLGYQSVSLRRNGIERKVYVHKLVARAFLGDPPGKTGCHPGEYMVNHRDRCRTNNVVSNLEWIPGQLYKPM